VPRTRRILRWGFILILSVVLLLGAVLARPAYHLARAALNDIDERQPLPPGYVDDASRLNRTQIRALWPIPADPAEAERQLAALLQRAQAEKIPVSIAGARHSMGGHSIAPDGIVIDMRPFDQIALDESRDVMTVQSGAIWADIIQYLDERGRSVEIMQSNNSFSVGGSLSVNCHGWQFGRPPIASTVESFRLMLADGSVVRCNRTENKELFSLVLGGYGLFGVILDVDLRVTKNVRLARSQKTLPVDETFSAFDTTMAEWPDAAMVYGRLNIGRERFLQDIIMIAFHPVAGDPPELAIRQAPGLRRTIFRASAESDYGKELRWWAETNLLPRFSKEYFSRNELLNEGVEIYENRTAQYTDILHEYFVPRENVHAFISELRRIVPAHNGNLLNVTVRSVNEDPDSFLRYADVPMFAFVMLFNQDQSAEGETAMQSMTREMIDAAIAVGGRYYLPYRLHATPEQFHRAYPQAREFFELKRKHDPAGTFQNMFYMQYGRAAAGAALIPTGDSGVIPDRN
jgi:FAD/FMN-containing dehydrogenase